MTTTANHPAAGLERKNFRPDRRRRVAADDLASRDAGDGAFSDQLQAVLLHELAHVRRYDLVANVLQRIVESLLFFHPAVWWLSRRVSLERENACDDLVICADCPPLKYADALLRVAELCAAVGRIPITDQNRIARQTILAATGDDSSHFKRRVLRLLGKRRSFTTAALNQRNYALRVIIRSDSDRAGNRSHAGKPTEAIQRFERRCCQTHRPDGDELAVKASFGHKLPWPPRLDLPHQCFRLCIAPNLKPIAGAKIYIASPNLGGKPIAETTSAASGRYEFNRIELPMSSPPDNSPGQPQRAGDFQVFGQADHFGFAWRPIKYFSVQQNLNERPGPKPDGREQFDSSQKIELDLKFSPAVELGGTVVDDRGQPIPNVQLELRYAEKIPTTENQFRGLPNNRYEFDALNEHDTVPGEMKFRATDKDGRFEFTGLPDGCRFVIDIIAPGFADQGFWAATQTDVKDPEGHAVRVDGMVIRLQQTMTVPVQVLFGDTGLPAPNVFVCGSGADSGSSATATTDDHGQATLKLPPGHYNLQLIPPYRAAYCVTDLPAGFDIAAGAPAAPAIATLLRPAGEVKITVVDAETAKAIAGIQLWKSELPVSSPHSDYFFRSWEAGTHVIRSDYPRTDADGKMNAFFAPGKYRLGVGWPFPPDGYEIMESEGEEVDLQPGKPVELTFHLLRKQ